MTKNKKKLRRVERRYSVTKSAQTLVLAGILLAGGVTGAMAAGDPVNTPAPWKNPTVTISDAASSVTVTTSPPNISPDTAQSSAKNVETTTLNITGGSLTLNGARILHYNYGSTPTITTGLDVNMTGGTLTINGNSTYSSMDVNAVTISDGIVNLTGNGSGSWNESAYIGAYKGLDISGGEVNMNINSELFAGNHLYITGGTINMEGNTAADDFGNDAAHIMFTDGNNNSIGGNAVINVVESGYGVMSTGPNLNITGDSEINIEGKLLLQPNAGERDSSLVYTENATATVNQTGGTITVADTGELHIYKTMTFNQNGGTVTNAGRIYETGTYILNSGTLNLTGAGGMIGAPTDAMTEADVTGTFTMNGGTLNVGKTDGTQGSQMQMDKVTIDGGTVNIQGKVDGDNWNNYALVYGGMGDGVIAEGTKVTGGTINMGDRAQLGVGYNAAGGSTMVISGGTINLNGGTALNAANIRASSDSTETSADTPKKFATLEISDNAKIAVAADKYGVILSRKTDMSGGSIDVNGTLTVAGTAVKNKTNIMTGIKNDTAAKWGNFNLSGGTVNVGTAGTLDFATGAVDLNISGGVLNTPTMTIVSTAAAEIPKGLYAKKVNITNTGTLKTDGLSINAANLVDTADAAGELGVAGTGTLHVNGTLALTGLSADYTSTHTGAVIAKKVTRNDFESHGYIQNTGSLTFLGTGADASFLDAKDLTVQGTGTVNLGTAAKGYTTNGGTYAGKVTVTDADGKLNVAAGNWKLTHADGLVQSNGAITIAGGNLTVDKFDQTSTGTTTIGGTAAGTLTVTGNAAGDYTSVGTADDAYGVEVKAMGTLNLQANALLTSAGALNSNIANIKGGGTLKVTGFTDNEISADGLGALKTMADKGLLDIGNTEITDLEQATGGGYDYDKVGGVANEQTKSEAVNVGKDTVEAGISGGFQTVTVTGAPTADVTAKVDGTLLLVGTTNNAALVSGTTGKTNLEVKADGGLLLGESGKTTSGTLDGDVKLNDGASLSVQGGSFKTDNITAGAANEGAVTVSSSAANGSTLNTGNVGSSSAAVANVTINNGSKLEATGTVNTKELALSNGGILSAGGAVTVTDAIVTVNTGNTQQTINTTGGSLTFSNGFANGEASNLKLEATNASTGDIKVVAGNLSGNKLDITAGKDLEITAGSLTLDGASKAEVAGELKTTGDVTLKGDSTLNAGTLNLGTGEKLAVDKGSVTIGKLTLTDGVHTVGTSEGTDGKGELFVKSANLSGATLFIDPVWKDGNKISDASQVAIENFGAAGNTLDGKIVVGRNSMLTLGSDNANYIKEQVAQQGTWGANGITAAMAIVAPIIIDGNGSLIVDGAIASIDASGNLKDADGTTLTYTATSGGVTTTINGASTNVAVLAKGSLTVVDVTKLNGQAALTGNNTGGGSTLLIQEDAKLRVDTNAQIGSYTLWDDFQTVNVDPGVLNTVVAKSPDRMIHTVVGADGKLILTSRDAKKVLPNISDSMGNLVNKVYEGKHNFTESSNAGIKFVSRAVNSDFLADNNQVAATIEGAAQLAVVGAAPAMTLSAVQAGTSTVTTRTSFASPLLDSSKAVALHKDVDGTLSVDSGLNAGNGMKNGFGLWIMPLYQSNSAWGMKADGFKGGYKSDLGGVALGADYTFNDMFRLGLAFNIGGGYAESNGDFNKTENSFNFWGINAYGGWTMNNFGITADAGYTGNYNKLQQELPSGMGMSDIKSDVNSSAWTAGLRGEYKFATEALDIIPHVGVRYTGLTTDEYKAKSGGDTVFKVDQDFQSIWTFPIGVTLAKEIETGSGWIIRPQVDLGITPATGDVKAKSKVRIPGVDAQAEMKMQVVDYMSYDGGVGLEMKKDNVSFGINYNIQASEHRTGHGVFGTFRYEF